MMMRTWDSCCSRTLVHASACALQGDQHLPISGIPCRRSAPLSAMRFRVGEPPPKPKEKDREPTEQDKPLAPVAEPLVAEGVLASSSARAGPLTDTPPSQGRTKQDASVPVKEEPSLKPSAPDENTPLSPSTESASTFAPSISPAAPADRPAAQPGPSALPLPAAREPDRESDSGSSLATEAYNSEDEHNRPGEGAASACGGARAGGSSCAMLTPEEREAAFRSELSRRQWEIVVVRADGNCLFRALAHALWGDEGLHSQLRACVMDHMLRQRDHFSQFVAEDFARYVRRKRRDGCHGNHVELQAAAELLAVRIEVYAYSLAPVTVVEGWHRREADAEPIRLSFHRGSHYNAVVSAARPRRRWAKKVPLAAMCDGGRPAATADAGRDEREEAEMAALADALATQEEIEQATLQMSILDMGRARRGSSSGSPAGGVHYGPLMDADCDALSKSKRARAGPSCRPPPSPSGNSVGSDGSARGGAGPSSKGPAAVGEKDNVEGNTEAA